MFDEPESVKIQYSAYILHCVRPCVRACVRVCVRACVPACVRFFVCVCVHINAKNVQFI